MRHHSMMVRVAERGPRDTRGFVSRGGSADSAATDAERHKESLVRWLRSRGYNNLGVATIAADMRRLVEQAHITEEDLMPPTVIHGKNRTFEIHWLAEGEEPPGTERCNAYDGAAQELRTRPGVWACLGEGGGGAASALRKRGLLVKERMNGHGRVLYACSPETDGRGHSSPRSISSSKA